MPKTKTFVALFLSTFLAAASVFGSKKEDLRVEVTVETFKEASETEVFFENAFGYAVFPTIGKGGFGIGAAYGKGRVYRQGVFVGDTSLTQVTIGFQLGGQVYAQFLFFEDETSLGHFQRGNFEMGAQASAVAATLGASADANYDEGVAVFTNVGGGLMYEATISGQKFKYEDL